MNARALSLCSLVALAACDDSTDVSDTASIQVFLTDAPSDYVGEAFVDIGAVELLPAGDGDRIVLSDDGTDGPINLLDLQRLRLGVGRGQALFEQDGGFHFHR